MSDMTLSRKRLHKFFTFWLSRIESVDGWIEKISPDGKEILIRSNRNVPRWFKISDLMNTNFSLKFYNRNIIKSRRIKI